MGPDELTPRERDVITLVRQGLTNAQIGERLGISADGVKYHVSEAMSKLGAESRYEAAELAVGRRKWWVYVPLVGLSVAALAVLSVLAWGIVKSDGSGDEQTGDNLIAAREVIAGMARAATRPGEILHTTAIVGDPSGAYTVEYYVDAEAGVVREESSQNRGIATTIIQGRQAYDEGATQPRAIDTQACDLTQEAWLVIFLRICAIQSIIGAPDYDITVRSGEWEGTEAQVVRAEGDFGESHNALELYVDAVTMLPLAIVVESSSQQSPRVTTFGTHKWVGHSPELDTLLDPASIGFTP